MIKFITNIHHAASSKLLKLLLLFLASLLISACDQDLAPIEADDFGYPKVTVYAKGDNVSGEEENQLSDWVSTGYKYNGDQVVIMAYNPAYSYGGDQPPIKYTWNPWLCQGDNDICTAMYYSPTCTLSQGYCHAPTDKYETIDNAPCYLSQGEGLYLLVTYPNGDVDNPNTYDNINRLPSDADMYTKSLWDPPVSGAEMYNNGTAAYGFSGELEPNSTYSTDADTGVTTEIPSSLSQSDYIDGRAYFKILDRYYDDNSGYQYAVMKRGFDSVIPPPIATVIDFVTAIMDETSKNLYQGIVENPEYRLSLKILLVLYMIVHGILFIGGASDMTQNELLSLFIKLTIVIQLLTGDDSWTLFNNYFFKFFTSGLDEMINIVTSNIDQSDNGFTFFDTLLSLLFSYETSMKIQALIWSFPSGFLVTFIIYAGFALFAIAIAKAVMIYLLAYMAITLLIIVSPIFICFMLFNQTRPLFETWLNAFANYFMQAVLVMAALNLFGQIIVDQIYMILGFKACFEDNPMLTIGTWCFSKSWFICSDLSTGLVSTEVPGYGYNTTTTVNCDANPGFECQDTSVYCEPFECIDNRYPDLPFLDPEIEKEYDLIQNFKSLNSLSIPMLYESCILLLMCYLMMEFNDVVPGLGKGLVKGGSAGKTALGSAANSSISDFKNTLSGMKNATLKMATGTSELERGIARRKLFNRGANAIRQGLSNAGLMTAAGAKLAAKGLDGAASRAYNRSGKLKALFYPIKKIKQTAVLGAKATGFILKGTFIGASILKDTVLKPGNLMIGTPEEIQARNNAVKNAKAYNRGKDAAEGKQVSLSYKEQLTKAMQDKTGITSFNERVASFDDKYMKNGSLNLRAVGGAMRRGAGQALYNTETGKAMYDGTLRLRDSIKEEYRARFTEQGRIDRENKRRKDNEIKALAEEYKETAPERNRREKQDRLASEALEQQCKNLNLDKELLLKMSQEDQELYIKRAYAELPEHLRDSIAATTSFDMLKAHLENDRIIRTKRDMDPSILVNEAYDALDINKGTFNSLDTKGQLAALEKGLRASDLTGPGASDAYRAYQYLKQRAEAQLASEKEAIREEKRKQSLVYKAGEAASSMKRMGQKGIHGVQHGFNRLGSLKSSDFTLKNVAIGASKIITTPIGMAGRAFSDSMDKRGITIDFGNARYTRKLGSFGGEGSARDKQLVNYKQRYDKDKIKIDSTNADLALQESCAVLGITKAALDTMLPEERKAYIEQAFSSTIAMDSSEDFERYRAYRAAQAVIDHHDEHENRKKSVIEEASRKGAERQQAIADTKRAEQEGIARQQAADRKVVEQRRDADGVNLCKALKMDHNELMLMDQTSQGKYLSRAYSALPQNKKDAELNKLYREMRDDIANNGVLKKQNEQDDISRSLSELGLTKEQLIALNATDRLAAIEKSFKDANLEVNGGDKHTAYETLKKKAQIDVEAEQKRIAAEEAKKETTAYKLKEKVKNTKESVKTIGGKTAAAVGTVVGVTAALSGQDVSGFSDGGASLEDLRKDMTGLGNDLKKKAKTTYNLVVKGRHTISEGSGTELEKNVLGSEIAHKKAGRTIDNDNANELLENSCATLGIDSVTVQSLSPERREAYLAEKLTSRLTELKGGKDVKYGSDEYKPLEQAYLAHGAAKEILDRKLVEDPFVTAQRQREATVSSYERQHRKDHHMQGLTGESTSGSLITRDVGVELGLDGAVLDLMTHQDVRTGAIGEKAAEVLGFSEEEIKSFASANKEDQLAMINGAMREEITDMSRTVGDNKDLSDDKHYLAYRTLKEIADKNVPPSTNPFDDDYVDPTVKATTKYVEDPPPAPDLFTQDVPTPREQSKADLFGDDHDVTLPPTTPPPEQEIPIATQQTGLVEEGINDARQQLGLDSNEITALKMMPQGEQLRALEEINDRIGESDPINSKLNHQAYTRLKEEAEAGGLKLTSDQYLSNYEGVYGVEPPTTKETLVNEATGDLDFSKQEKLLFNAVDDKEQLAMVASKAGEALGMDLSEVEQFQAFSTLDKMAKLERIARAIKSKELNADNAGRAYKAYKTLRRIAEHL